MDEAKTMPEAAFKLGKPPIVEAWIKATLVSTDEREWSWDSVSQLLDTYETQLPIAEFLPDYKPEPTSWDEKRRPTAIKIEVNPRYLRRRTATRDSIVQVGRNEVLVCHVRTENTSYPGFPSLRDGVLEAIRRYQSHVGPATVVQVEIHYVDIVVLEGVVGREVELRKFFVGAPDLASEPFGPSIDAAWKFAFRAPEDIGFGEFAVKMLSPEGANGRFRLDWHCAGQLEPNAAVSRVAAKLQAMHNYLKLCFKSVCQPIWKTFDPLNEAS